MKQIYFQTFDQKNHAFSPFSLFFFRTKCMNPSNFSLWRFHLLDLNLTTDFQLKSVRIIQEFPFKEESCPSNGELITFFIFAIKKI